MTVVVGCELARYLGERRQSCGLPLRALAELSGVGKSTLHAWERGSQLPSVPELDRLLEVYGVAGDERRRVLAMIPATRARKELARSETSEPISIAVDGDLIRALRLRRHFGVGELSRLIEVDPTTIIKWERGHQWPGPGAMQSLLFALDASADEVELLTTAHAIGPTRDPFDYDAIELTLFRLRHNEWHGAFAHAELRLLAMLPDIWNLRDRDHRANRAYIEACVRLAFLFLTRHGDLETAYRYAQEAIRADSTGENDDLLPWPVHICAKHAAYGGRRKRPRAGMRMIAKEISRFTHRPNIHAWYLRDISEFLADENAMEEALVCSKTAMEIGAAGDVDPYHERFDHAELLIRAHRADAALEFLTPPTHIQPLQGARESLAWAEALVQIGEYDRAHSYLSEATPVLQALTLSGLRDRYLRVMQRLESHVARDLAGGC